MTNRERVRRINERIKRITLVLNTKGSDVPIMDVNGSCFVLDAGSVVKQPSGKPPQTVATGRIGTRFYNPEGDMR